MSELAFNVNGEPFEVPGGAAAWRVRRLKQKGAPEVVYGRDGLPLVLAIDAELDDLRREAGGPGRYRLDPIDENHKAIAGAQAGYVFVHAGAAPVETQTTAMPTPSDNVAIEAMRMNAEMARTIIDRFPQMMEAAATLLRAADGAGLPAREPRVIDEAQTDDDEDTVDDEAEAPPAFDLNTLIAQIVPVVIASLGNGKLKLPGLSSLLDWRKAVPANKSDDAAAEPARVKPVKPAVKPAPTTLPPIDPTMMAHFVAVQAALTPEESALAREVAKDLSPAELRSWFDELSKLSVPEAAERIRKTIGGTAKDGGAS